jgi:hypothetical protein
MVGRGLEGIGILKIRRRCILCIWINGSSLVSCTSEGRDAGRSTEWIVAKVGFDLGRCKSRTRCEKVL